MVWMDKSESHSHACMRINPTLACDKCTCMRANGISLWGSMHKHSSSF